MKDEKQIKSYKNAIRRRLNLPKDVKKRVMSDLESSIQARLEGEMTVQQVMEELGSPKKVASDLNEQMKEFAYRKSPWRYVFAAAAAYGAAQLLERLWSFLALVFFKLSLPTHSASVGIIGGADGPTAIFVTGPFGGLLEWILPAVLIATGIWGFFRLCKCRQKE